METQKYEHADNIAILTIDSCAKLIQALSITHRFGWQAMQFCDGEKTPNYQMVRDEINYVKRYLSMLDDEIKVIELHPSSWTINNSTDEITIRED